MPRSAHVAVLETAELLEMITEELPARQVLTQAQAVTHLWHDTITTWPNIQQALFLQPTRDHTIPEKTTIRNRFTRSPFPHLSLSTILTTPGQTTMINNTLGLKDSAAKPSSLPLLSTSKRNGMTYEHASWRRRMSRRHNHRRSKIT